MPANPVLPAVPPLRHTGSLGIVMLDTQFPRPLGDVGHPHSFGVPVIHRVVPGAWPTKVVAAGTSLRASGVAALFVQAARELEHEGACAITTSCGFLVLLQSELQAAVQVPVVTSSLLQLPALLALERQVGVLTISARHLGAEHLLAAGVAPDRLSDVVVQGVDPHGEFATVILGNRKTMDLEKAQHDVVQAARKLKARAPRLRSVVLECTNMPPYAQSVRDATGFELRWLHHVPALRAPFA